MDLKHFFKNILLSDFVFVFAEWPTLLRKPLLSLAFSLCICFIFLPSASAVP